MRYLEYLVSASNALRKVKCIKIFQNFTHTDMQKLGKIGVFFNNGLSNIWLPRPQLHIMLVTPFGTRKTTFLGEIERINPKEYKTISDFTPPGFQGTINDRGMFVPGSITTLGGKTLLIDEFSELPFRSKDMLLKTLENQRFQRSLGYKLNTKVNLNKKFCKIKSEGNTIFGNVQFSCIAATMYWAKRNTPKENALLSRFFPIFLEPTMEEVVAMGAGVLNSSKISYFSPEIPEVRVTEDAYREYYFQAAAMALHVNDKRFRLPKGKYGMFPRVNSDIVRLAVANYIIEKKPKKGQEVVIDSAEPLLKALPHMPLEMMLMKTCTLNLTQLDFLRNYIENPNIRQKEIAENMQITEVHASKVASELKRLGFML